MKSTDVDEDDIQTIKKMQQRQEEVKKIIANQESSNPCMDLANRSMQYVPRDILLLTYIEHLYLEGNNLQDLPRYFFESLPNLKWLDLRNNNLTHLPSTIGKHRNLKNVLLEHNQITYLPLELGFARTITGLSLRGNPLQMPPSDVVKRGVQAILSYLREELHNSKNLPENEEEQDDLSEDDSNYMYDGEEDDRFSIPSPMNDDAGFEFNPLKYGPTPVPAQFHKPQFVNKHKEMSWRGRSFDRNGTTVIKASHINMHDNRNGSGSQQHNDKEWMARFHQRKKNSVVLDEWREEAKRLQKILLPRSKTEISHPNPPFGVDIQPSQARPVTKEEHTVHSDTVEEKVNRIDPKNVKSKERLDSEVQSRIRLHTSQLQNRLKGTSKDDALQPGRELQRELLNDKMAASDPRLEYRFRAFTGDSSSFTSSNKTSSL